MSHDPHARARRLLDRVLARADRWQVRALDAEARLVAAERRLCAAEGRLTLARIALVDTGYFEPHEVGDDVAPRITEYAAAVRHGDVTTTTEPEPATVCRLPGT